MSHPYREFSDDRIPLAYFISFRAYGTWLHGDERCSVDRFHNIYGTPKIPPNDNWKRYNAASLKQPPVYLDQQRRAAIEKAIRETCEIRGWVLLAFNVRTNHIHVVVSANCKPEPVLNAFKANATREMRQAGCWDSERKPFVRRGSKKYLWDEKSVAAAIAYVLDGQGDPLD
jgi:REP element-mobilizing transposase RayT